MASSSLTLVLCVLSLAAVIRADDVCTQSTQCSCTMANGVVDLSGLPEMTYDDSQGKATYAYNPCHVITSSNNCTDGVLCENIGLITHKTLGTPEKATFLKDNAGKLYIQYESHGMTSKVYLTCSHDTANTFEMLSSSAFPNYTFNLTSSSACVQAPATTTAKPKTTAKAASTVKPSTSTAKATSTAKPTTTVKPSTSTAKATSTAKSTAKSSTAKSSTAKSSTAKSSTAKSSSAKPTTATTKKSSGTTSKTTSKKPSTGSSTSKKPSTGSSTSKKPSTGSSTSRKPTTPMSTDTTTQGAMSTISSFSAATLVVLTLVVKRVF